MKKLNTIMAAMTLAAASTANAGEITKWTYVNEAGFSSYEETKVGAVTPSGDATPTGILGVPANTLLEWGQPLSGNGINGADGLQSSLRTDSPITGDIYTDGVAVQGTDLFHNNYVVGSQDGKLSGATFLDGLELMPLEVEGVPYVGPAFTIPAPILGFDINFLETSNGVDYGLKAPNYNVATKFDLDDTLVCPDGTLNGQGVNEFGCADIFAVTSDITDFAIVDGNIEFSGDFVLDGYIYTITTILSGLELITDAACNTVGLADGCFGFLTKEETSNQLVAQFKLDAEKVPVRVSAPASIAILGLGLIGLGGLARRKKK